MIDELQMAIACWRRWHNAMSRRWVRAAIKEYRLERWLNG